MIKIFSHVHDFRVGYLGKIYLPLILYSLRSYISHVFYFIYNKYIDTIGTFECTSVKREERFRRPTVYFINIFKYYTLTHVFISIRYNIFMLYIVAHVSTYNPPFAREKRGGVNPWVSPLLILEG